MRHQRFEWRVLLERPPVDRIEYRFRVEHASGHTAEVLDPANPLQVPGPFGASSVLELPGYQRPPWVGHQPAGRRRTRPLDIPVPSFGPARMGGELWSPAGTRTRDRLPLVVVHDGPEYARLASLTTYLDHAVGTGTMPPVRAALLAPLPGARNEHYAASPGYAAALASDVLPHLAALAPAPPGRPVIGVGASLGALALLHAHRLHRQAFAGLFLQSGSYFQRASDPTEVGFPRFSQIGRFVRGVSARRRWQDPVPVTITVGLGEENLGNNRAMAASLLRQGYPVQLVEVADAHTWVGWRDAFHPHLADLVGAALA